MNATTLARPTETKVFLTPLFFALPTVFILFFIDEGYYDLRWMKEPGNWLVFVIYNVIFYAVYGAGFLLSWLLSAKLLLRKYRGENKEQLAYRLSMLLGPAVVMVVLFWKIFSAIFSQALH